MVYVYTPLGTPGGLAPGPGSSDYVLAGLTPPGGVFRSFRAMPVMRHSDITISVVYRGGNLVIAFAFPPAPPHGVTRVVSRFRSVGWFCGLYGKEPK